jgi:hypothetical protein
MLGMSPQHPSKHHKGTGSRMVYAIFDDEAMAAKAVDELVESDFTLDHICVLMREGPPHSNVTELPVDVKSKVARGVKVGTALGVVG